MASRRKHDIAGKNLVGFEVAGVAYAVDIQRVREIVRPLPTLSLPHVPDEIVGVVDHRGNVVPVIDLRKRFGVAASGRERDARWIIVNRGERLLGLAVDRVSEVFGAEDGAARDLPQIGAGDTARGIKAAYFHGGRLVFVLEVDELTRIADDLALAAPATAARVSRDG
jgi:purine-binding chemotaxis protein CheW